MFSAIGILEQHSEDEGWGTQSNAGASWCRMSQHPPEALTIWWEQLLFILNSQKKGEEFILMRQQQGVLAQVLSGHPNKTTGSVSRSWTAPCDLGLFFQVLRRCRFWISFGSWHLPSCRGARGTSASSFPGAPGWHSFSLLLLCWLPVTLALLEKLTHLRLQGRWWKATACSLDHAGSMACGFFLTVAHKVSMSPTPL